MMESTREVADRFDRVSASYDATREQLTMHALDRVEALLRKDGVVSVLEAGVGTGRMAIPLQERGFDITGLDLSPGMLLKAKEKGIRKLVIAEASNPPFRRKTIDAVLLAHVLQLLEDPALTFRRLSEVAKKEIYVFLRKPEACRDGANEAREEFYRAFGVAARELGVTLGRQYEAWPERYAKQDDFLKRFPPDGRVTIQDMDYTESMAGYMSATGPGCCKFTTHISEADFNRVVERMKLTMNFAREIPYRRVDQMLVWHL
jgi:ubiquinone/menaquinone biosynthesis C-methylase UbiE